MDSIWAPDPGTSHCCGTRGQRLTKSDRTRSSPLAATHSCGRQESIPDYRGFLGLRWTLLLLKSRKRIGAGVGVVVVK
jgi:hypothetical protein